MNVIETHLSGCLIIEPKIFGDQRGFFLETYQEKRYQEMGIREKFVQDNRSRSSRGVLRGLHFQKKRPQGKLVSVTFGEVFDVAVDLRPSSATFGQFFGVVLSAEKNNQLYIPPGFAHGFSVLSDFADFAYKCTDYYDASDEGGIVWNDPEVGIDWRIVNPIISEKDKNLPTLKEYMHKVGFQK